MKEFKLPDPGEGLVEAEIVAWHVAEGDQVRVNDIVLEIETSKSIVELPIPWSGTVTKLLVEVGQTVPIGTPVVVIDDGVDDTAPDHDSGDDATSTSAADGDTPEPMLVGYGPNDQVLDDAMRERFIDSAVVRARVSQIPSSEGYLEAVRVGLGWGLLPQAQALPLLAAKELVLLDGSPLDIDLYWQRWRLESEVLSDLTRSVINAAAGLGRA